MGVVGCRGRSGVGIKNSNDDSSGVHSAFQVGAHPGTVRDGVVATVALPVCVAEINGFHGPGALARVVRYHAIFRVAIVEATGGVDTQEICSG